MLNPGDKVVLTYYEGERQIESFNWVVEEYDNGLLKVSRLAGKFELKGEIIREWEETKPVIFNMRSIGFFKVELAE